jgi:D-3-phosphoglycerate dehydrogenase
LIAEQHGITIEQSQDAGPGDYQNAIYTKATAGSEERIVAGVLFGGRDPRIVQVDSYHLDANPYGTILVLQNRDVPGVIGQVGTILGAHNVNVGEWRMGRHAPGSDALSFINMDSAPSAEVLEALREIQAITSLKLIRL